MLSKDEARQAHTDADCPADWARLSDFYDEELRPVFTSFKTFQHHFAAVQRELEQSGAVIRIGRLLYVHKEDFWPKFREAHTKAAQQRAGEMLARQIEAERTAAAI